MTRGPVKSVDLEALVRPMADRLVRDVVEILLDRVGAMIVDTERAFDAVISAVAGELARGGAEVQETSTHSRPGRGKRQESATVDDPAEGVEGSAPEPAGRSSARPKASASAGTAASPGPKCSKCGTPGHNARSCGRAPKGNSRGSRISAGAREALERTRAARAAQEAEG